MYSPGFIGGTTFGGTNFATSAVPRVTTRPGSTAPSFTLNFQASGGAGTAPTLSKPGTPGLTGLNNFANCIGTWSSNYASGGTAYTRTYEAGALCTRVNGGTGGNGIYYSSGKTFGAEVWTPSPLTIGSLTPVAVTTFPTAGSTCYNAIYPNLPESFLYYISAASGAQQVQRWTCNGNGGVWQNDSIPTSIRIATASSTDTASQLTMAGGTISYTFTGTYTSAPICTAADATAIAAVRGTTTATTLTIHGTGSDVVHYGCFGRN